VSLSRTTGGSHFSPDEGLPKLGWAMILKSKRNVLHICPIVRHGHLYRENTGKVATKRVVRFPLIAKTLMSRTFVAVDDPVHRLMRNMTHRTPLLATTGSDGKTTVNYLIEDRNLPDAYYSLALLHSLGGLAIERAFKGRCALTAREREGIAERVGYFDVTRLDRRCARDLRWRPASPGAYMVSAELISYGTGVLRARNDDIQDVLHREIWSRHGRLTSRHEKIYATVVMLHRRTPGQKEFIGRERYDSTNLIYGDALGELQQLWDRRADTQFLEQVTSNLRSLKETGSAICQMRPPLNVPAAMQLHFQRQAVWKTPPETARSLLRRVEYLLSRVVVDSWPQTVFRFRATGSEPSGTGWTKDTSGNDGWLDE